MDFDFEVPAPLKLGCPVDYYRGILSNYRHVQYEPPRNMPIPKTFGTIILDGHEYAVRGWEEGGVVVAFELQNPRSSDAFVGIPFSLPSKKLELQARAQGFETNSDKYGVYISDGTREIDITFERGRVAAISWNSAGE